jgi:hypothetical protein
VSWAEYLMLAGLFVVVGTREWDRGERFIGGSLFFGGIVWMSAALASAAFS